MVKKDFTEYDRDQKDFTKKPLSKDFQKLIFPPKSDIKKSEEQDASVLPATPKLSMRKKAIVTGDYVPEEDISRLEEIKEKLLTLVDEAKRIVSGGDRMTYERAKSYWIPHVIMALTKEHEWLGGSMVTMEDTIEELKEWLPGGSQFRGEEEEEPTEEPEPKVSSIKLNPKTGAWENLPKGWTEESLKSFWNSLGGKGEHKVTKCIEKMKGDIDNPGAFCASLERRIESSNLENKKLAVGDKILTSTKKKAKVVKVGTELTFWMSDEGGEKDFGSDFVNDIELIEPVKNVEPVEGGLTKEVPLEERVAKKKFAGTWSLPFTEEKANKLGDLVEKIEEKGINSYIESELYDLYGDDALFDDIDALLNPLGPQIVKVIKSAIKDLLEHYRSNPEDFNKEKPSLGVSAILQGIVEG